MVLQRINRNSLTGSFKVLAHLLKNGVGNEKVTESSVMALPEHTSFYEAFPIFNPDLTAVMDQPLVKKFMDVCSVEDLYSYYKWLYGTTYMSLETFEVFVESMLDKWRKYISDLTYQNTPLEAALYGNEGLVTSTLHVELLLPFMQKSTFVSGTSLQKVRAYLVRTQLWIALGMCHIAEFFRPYDKSNFEKTGILQKICESSSYQICKINTEPEEGGIRRFWAKFKAGQSLVSLPFRQTSLDIPVFYEPNRKAYESAMFKLLRKRQTSARGGVDPGRLQDQFRQRFVFLSCEQRDRCIDWLKTQMKDAGIEIIPKQRKNALSSDQFSEATIMYLMPLSGGVDAELQFTTLPAYLRDTFGEAGNSHKAYKGRQFWQIFQYIMPDKIFK